MSRRSILIPALTDTDGQPAAVTIGVSLVDANRTPLIGYTVDAGVIEPFSVSADPDGTELTLVPQSEIHGETYYQIALVSAHRRAVHLIQVPSGTDPIALQDLLILADPVEPADYARLLPDATTLEDGLWLTTSDGAWAATNATPSGVPDAPLTDGPYGRQSGAWVTVAAPLTVLAAISISGHRAIAADADGQAIYADQADETALAVLGLSTQAATTGDPLIVVAQGPLDWPAGGLTPDAPLFLGASGTLTHTAPTSGWVRQIAQAVDTDRLIISIGPAYRAG